MQDWIRAQIGERGRRNASLGDWPRRIMAEQQVLLVHGDNLTLWFLAPDGTLFSLDTDSVAQRLEIERHPTVIREVLGHAARAFPELRELVGEP